MMDFGPGVGLLWAFSFSAFLGYNLSKSTSHTSVVNFISNLVALIIFLINGEVVSARNNYGSWANNWRVGSNL